MATLLTNLRREDAVSRSPQLLTNEGSASINTNEFFFYSNSPESFNAEALADRGKFLNSVSNLSGTGQIYTWHRNKTNSSIKNCLLFYNPNSYQVTVNVTNYGLTSISEGTDLNAWKDYYDGNSTSLTIAAGGYANMFLRTIPNNYCFGIVARATIVRSGTSTPAGVTIWDLAYIDSSKSGNAAGFADLHDPEDEDRNRGSGTGFYTTINAPTLSPANSTNGVGFTIGANTDTFNGNDCSYITDPSGKTSGRLAGAYGQQFYVNLPIHNSSSSAKTYRIFIGSTGGGSFPFVYLNGSIAKLTGNAIDAFKYIDVIEETVPANQTKTVSFSTVVAAMASTPYVIGAREK